MFRKFLIAAVASLSLLSPLAMPAQSEAHDYPVHPRHRVYRVFVRDCYHEPWRVYRTFRDRDDAYRAARFLRMRGLEAFVR